MIKIVIIAFLILIAMIAFNAHIAIIITSIVIIILGLIIWRVINSKDTNYGTGSTEEELFH